MITKNGIYTYVIHYSLLNDRAEHLRKKLFEFGIDSTWITEKDFYRFQEVEYNPNKTLGVLNKLIGMDLGLNSRSIKISRKKAKWQGYVLFFRSFLNKKK